MNKDIYSYNVVNYQDGLKLVFQNLFNPTFCESFLDEYNNNIEKLKEKAKAISFLAKTSYGYWNVNSTNLGAKVVSRYYALLHSCFAEQVARESNINLTLVEKSAKQGHGFFAKLDDDNTIEDFNIGILSQGYFGKYAKSINIHEEIKPFLSKNKECTNNKIIRLLDLLSYVPELRDSLNRHGIESKVIGICHIPEYKTPTIDRNLKHACYLMTLYDSTYTIEDLKNMFPFFLEIKKTKDLDSSSKCDRIQFHIQNLIRA